VPWPTRDIQGFVREFAKKEPVLIILLAVLAVLTAANPGSSVHYPEYVDWNTIIALSGLIVVTTGIKESGLLHTVSRNLVTRAGSERGIAFTLVLISAVLSTVLTNDITLLVVVPLTLSIGEMLRDARVVEKLVIFETLAVNVGSALTPIGNPQNLFLWHEWGISFLHFCREMLPPVLLMLSVLVFFVFVVFGGRKLDVESRKAVRVDRNLALVSSILVCSYVAALELKLELLAFLAVISIYLLFFRRVLKRTDWLLILIFVLMFIDVGCVARMAAVRKAVSSMNLKSASSVFLISALLSQIMSNVPAAMFISHFSNNWRAICYGVNVGGNGVILASLANIISVRYAGSKMLLDFHKYSVVYFAVTLLLVLVLMF